MADNTFRRKEKGAAWPGQIPRVEDPRAGVPRGKGSTGEDSRGRGSRRQGLMVGQVPMGEDPRGQRTRGQDPRGQSWRGHSSRGKDPRGHATRGQGLRGLGTRGYQGPIGKGTRGQGPRGQSRRGHITRREDPRGQGTRGQDPRGQSTRGQDPRGQSTSGQEPRGQSTSGQGPRGQSTSGQGPRGQGDRGKGPRGQSPSGHGSRGEDPYGQGTRGQDPKSQSRRGHSTRGEDPRDQSPGGQSRSGHGSRGEDPYGQGTRGQDPKSQSRRGHSTRGEDPRDQSPGGQSRSGHGSRGEDPYGQGTRGQGPKSQSRRGHSTRGQDPIDQSPRGQSSRGEGSRCSGYGRGRGDRNNKRQHDDHSHNDDRQGQPHRKRRMDSAQQHGDQGARRYNVAVAKPPTKPPGYMALQSMLRQERDPSTVVQELSSYGNGLEILLSEPGLHRDQMAILVRVLAKICQCRDSGPQSLTRVLSMVVDTAFLGQNLVQHISGLVTETDGSHLWQAPEQISAALTLMDTLLQRVHRSVTDVQVVLVMIEAVAPKLEKNGLHISEADKTLLSQRLLFCRQTQQRAATKTQHPRTAREAGAPPDDFRALPIVPDAAELTTTAKAYLRANVVKGRYEDLQHYLDIQFRLLRQDFLEPLKLGIADYRQTAAKVVGRQKQRNVRMYHGVRVLRPVCLHDGITHRVNFDTRGLEVKWESSKRLTFGSLVCLSNDNFRSVLFATVANRNPQDLAHGWVGLRFQSLDQVTCLSSTDSTFVMAEFLVLFEAYRPILQALQKVSEDTLPLQRYIIEVSREILPPAYLQQKTSAVYDLRAPPFLDDKDDDLHTAPHSPIMPVDILYPAGWPRAEELECDESQLKALQAALTQELAIIQGPPGTGKTYIGLKIVQALLDNKAAWGGQGSPILVVCYTNHALDQFLEGILGFTRKVVRVGGRSNSEVLQEMNLKYLRRNQTVSASKRRAPINRILVIQDEMASTKDLIHRYRYKVSNSMNGIIGEEYLQPFMSKDQYSSLTEAARDEAQTMASRIPEWLELTTFWVVQGMEGGRQEGKEPQEDELEEGEIRDGGMGEERIEVDEEADIEREGFPDDWDDNSFDQNPDKSQLVHSVDNVRAGQPASDGRKIRGNNKFLRNLRKAERMSEEEAQGVQNVWAMGSLEARWQLYRLWVQRYCSHERAKIREAQRTYEKFREELQEVPTEKDVAILEGADVIGMTSTGAAKHHSLLHWVGPRIVVVEEAAEVLEAHIVTALNPECQHLILIGDHQQLRPNPMVYRLAKDFKLDMSLFERMINNGVPYTKLSHQHRMRPEISAIMKHHFYPQLQDHESVLSYPNVRGVDKDLYFLDHSIKEQEIEDSMSKSNLHEAEVLVGLCKYLIQQVQYPPSKITILTPYLGQLRIFKQLMPESVFEGVRVCVVDNFQGEENDIILLSLVRSNETGTVGFLKVSNRVCVALSRARHGLYCIGNFQALAQADERWHVIVEEMRDRELLGQHLSLVCQNHPETVTRIQTGTDFHSVPEGGCNLACSFRLDCGHSCGRLCHLIDPKHKDVKCLKKCDKLLACGHKCLRKCFQECGQCITEVTKTLPCGHDVKISCHQDPDEYLCTKPCERGLPCGHMCKEVCGSPCTQRCQEPTIRSDFPCGHVVEVKCCEGPEDCPEPCKATLDCSHPCTGTCGSCHRGRLHEQCRQPCNRILVCGHACKAQCTRDCPPCRRSCENSCVHSRCMKSCGEACAPCREPCPWRCAHHACNTLCSEACDRPPCDRPCPESLPCGHPCIGLCGEPCPNKCRLCHKAEVTEIFFGEEDEPDACFVQLEDCGHLVEVSALDRLMSTDPQSSNSVRLRECPRCKTPIRRNRRYGSSINEALANIESVKAKILGDVLQRGIVVDRIKQLLKGNMHIKRRSLSELMTIENQAKLIKAIMKAIKKAEAYKSQCKAVEGELIELRKWLMKRRPNFITCQELEEGSLELHRLTLCLDFALIKGSLPTGSDDIDLESVESLLAGGRRLDEASLEKTRRCLERLKQKCPGLCISEEERVMVVKAMGLTQGHWFKCPSGHVYAIGECGGATEESTCPECKATIGGKSHRLHETNRLAGEMDGARFAAFSDRANLANYDPGEL